ncbi:hypothetical protein D3C87_1900780 [compost metagenome]
MRRMYLFSTYLDVTRTDNINIRNFFEFDLKNIFYLSRVGIEVGTVGHRGHYRQHMEVTRRNEKLR